MAIIDKCLLAERVASWGEPEEALVRRREEQQSGWLLLLHLRNRGNQSMCTWRVSLICDLWCLSTSLTWPHPVQCGVAMRDTSAAARAARLALSFVLGLLNLCSFCSVV